MSGSKEFHILGVVVLPCTWLSQRFFISWPMPSSELKIFVWELCALINQSEVPFSLAD